MKKVIMLLSVILCLSAGIFAQSPSVAQTKTKTVKAPPAPESFVAKYQGGMFGYSQKEQGSLKFDDANEKLKEYKF